MDDVSTICKKLLDTIWPLVYIACVDHAPSHIDVINSWPSLDALASDCLVQMHAVRKWRTRNNIPPQYWPALVAAAHDRDLPVTYRGLAVACAIRDERMLSDWK